ncbi:DUF2993 domain-containing protein [Dendronalium sp. ChiSLP03b]|uniref:LmeA family phospholipid-binding protein n=1 Tax=Dendronalium sp. ChiSLP03b TaxID=3075381 RepID=UPI002AD52C1F|nr:DUF2993 domain-containing protein [Dendronalium sp. ChiSLP03b]MDZ8207611.1 DUF2993 domain-containing protein [Dendronalium sp. ChiSLP03b]
MRDEQSLEGKLLSQEAKRRVLHELDEVEQIDIEVQTDVLKIVQGQANAVSVSGQGLVIREDIRVQEIKLQTDSIAINPLSALLGQIKLDEPVKALARIILTETDINRTLSSDFTRSLGINFDVNVDGEIVNFESQKIQVFLPGDDQIEFRGKLLLKEKGNTRSLAYQAIVHPRTSSQPLMLESFNCTEGQGMSIELIVALMQKVKELVNQPYFEWDDMKFSVKNLELEKGSLTLLVEAYVKQIPLSSNVLSPQ